MRREGEAVEPRLERVARREEVGDAPVGVRRADAKLPPRLVRLLELRAQGGGPGEVVTSVCLRRGSQAIVKSVAEARASRVQVTPAAGFPRLMSRMWVVIGLRFCAPPAEVGLGATCASIMLVRLRRAEQRFHVPFPEKSKARRGGVAARGGVTGGQRAPLRALSGGLGGAQRGRGRRLCSGETNKETVRPVIAGCPGWRKSTKAGRPRPTRPLPTCLPEELVEAELGDLLLLPRRRHQLRVRGILRAPAGSGGRHSDAAVSNLLECESSGRCVRGECPYVRGG